MIPSSLSDALDIFLAQPHLKVNTVKAYRQALDALIKYMGPSRPLHHIEPLELQRFWNWFTGPSKDYSPYTVRKHYRSLKAFWNWCVSMQIIERSPFTGIRPPRVPRYSSRQKAMTDAEYHAILNYALYSSPRNYALIIFLGDTGCRAIGASRVKVGDVNLDDRTALITGKGDKQRVVYFGERCAMALKNWIRQKPSHTGEYLFRQVVNRKGDKDKPLNSDSLRQIVRKTALKAGIKRPLGTHALRHRKGHQLADSGTPITVSAKALGHASTETTQQYYPDDDERVRRKMEELSTDAKKQLSAKSLRKIIPLHPKHKAD